MAYNVNEYWKSGQWCWADYYERTPTGQYYTQTALNNILRTARRAEVSSVLDVGAGAGRFALPLQKMGYQVTAIDIDRQALDSMDGSGVKVHHGDFVDYDFGADRFDMVISIGVVKYLEGLEPFLKRAYTLLNPGGRIVFEMVNPRGPRKAMSRLYERMSGRKAARADFRTVLSIGECRDALRDCGFDDVRVRSSFILVPPNASRRVRLYRVLAGLERVLGLQAIPSLGSQYYAAATRRK